MSTIGYAAIESRLRRGGVVVLDGGTGTELQRRGVSMDPHAWCGPAALAHAGVLEDIHRDYIAAGADIVTANTFASSRLMLGAAGLADRFDEINRAAIATALAAREASGCRDVLVAGSLSHMVPIVRSAARPDPDQLPSADAMAAAFGELALLLRDAGCDLILLEMMHDPVRTAAALDAAAATGLPVWAGFSARRGPDGEVLSYRPDADMPFADVIRLLAGFNVAAAGVMHTSPNVTGDALALLRTAYEGPLMAYPDSGYFKMPDWQFQDVIPPKELLRFATAWVRDGVQIVGGCCGLSPEHIGAVAILKDRAPS